MTPRVRRSQQSSEAIFQAERAEETVLYLSRHEYTSMHHGPLALLWETGMRMGAAYLIDQIDGGFKRERTRGVRRLDLGTTPKNL